MILAWRIIPASKCFITTLSKSPKDRVVPLPNGHSWLLNGGDPNHWTKSWDDPPSGRIPVVRTSSKETLLLTSVAPWHSSACRSRWCWGGATSLRAFVGHVFDCATVSPCLAETNWLFLGMVCFRGNWNILLMEKNPANQLIGSVSHFLQGFIMFYTSQVVSRISEPSTVVRFHEPTVVF